MQKKPTILVTLIVLGFPVAVYMQTQTRSITSDDFASQRPAAATTSVAGGKRGQKRRYRKPLRYNFIRSDRNTLRHRRSKKPLPAVSTVKVTEVGVTIWRMRPPRPGEAGFLLPVKDGQDRKMWVAERVPDDTTFKAGDKIRFAIESSASGYLYVFDREMYSDGSFGEPVMIFPERPTDDNSLRPGMLFDIPDQREDLPYFNMTAQGDGYAGEILTIVLAPKPLSIFSTDERGRLKSVESLTDLEFGSLVEVFTRGKADVQDKVFSKVEAEAACGVKGDQNKEDRSACRVTSRELTRDEPLPQSIYRISSIAGEPAVAFIKLAVK